MKQTNPEGSDQKQITLEGDINQKSIISVERINPFWISQAKVDQISSEKDLR